MEGSYYSYRMVSDTTFAPNPHHKVLTLATCKPVIRRTAKVGDWIIGLAGRTIKNGVKPNPGEGLLIYLAQVSEILPLEEYWVKYPVKRPNQQQFDNTHAEYFGDNIYYQENGVFKQVEGCMHRPEDTQHDTNGRNALICKVFHYFAPEDRLLLPKEFENLIHNGRGHSHKSLPDNFEEFKNFVAAKAGNKSIKGKLNLKTARVGCSCSNKENK